MANLAQRVAALFSSLCLQKKRGSREIKMRIIQDPRTKTMTLGEDNVTNNMKFWRLPESCSLKYARHYRREKEEEKEREKKKSYLKGVRA